MWDCHGDKDSARPACSKGADPFSEPIDFDDTWPSILRCLWPWFLYCTVVLVIFSWASMGQSDNFSAEYWTRLHGAGESLYAYLPLSFIEGMSCSSQ